MTTRKRILVVDDDLDLLELLKRDLSSKGYEVLVANNGKDGLDITLREPLDLVLLDVMLPYIDGYHFTQEVTSRLATKAPRILIMSCRDTVKEKGIALTSGAIEVLQKPFEMAKLYERLTAILAD